MPKPLSKEIKLDTAGKPVGLVAAAYVSTKSSIKKLEEQGKTLRTPLEKYLAKNKVVDASGSEKTFVTHMGAQYCISNKKRESVIEKPGAIRKIKARFPNLAKKLIETVEVIRLDRLEEMLNNDEITESQAKQFVEIRSNFAFQVTRVKK